jgi:hypothetical protein
MEILDVNFSNTIALDMFSPGGGGCIDSCIGFCVGFCINSWLKAVRWAMSINRESAALIKLANMVI